MKIDLERLLPNRPEDTDIQILDIGDHRYPALLVDGFYRDPDHMRELALSLRYRIPPGPYPGYWAAVSLDIAPIASFIHQCFADGYFASAEAMAEQATSWQFFNGERRPGDPPRPRAHRPHVDTGLLVGLVYLNRPEHCRGGTSFFRHKETGTESLFFKELHEGRRIDGRLVDPAVKDRLWRRGAHQPYDKACAAGLATRYDDYWKRVMNTPGNENGTILESCGGWELTRVVEMKFNRLLLFPGFMLHSTHFEPEWFDNTPECWRLTHNFMFDWPLAAPASVAA